MQFRGELTDFYSRLQVRVQGNTCLDFFRVLFQMQSLSKRIYLKTNDVQSSGWCDSFLQSLECTLWTVIRPGGPTCEMEFQKQTSFHCLFRGVIFASMSKKRLFNDLYENENPTDLFKEHQLRRRPSTTKMPSLSPTDLLLLCTLL